jgi:hypothetical protein
VSTVFVGEHTVPATGSTFRHYETAYINAWRTLPASVKHIFVLRDDPHMDAKTAPCVSHAMARHEDAGLACAQPRSAALPPDPAAWAGVHLRSPRVQVINLTPFFCSSRLCYPVVGGVLVYKDVNHLTQAYATSLGPYLLRAINKLMQSWQ